MRYTFFMHIAIVKLMLVILGDVFGRFITIIMDFLNARWHIFWVVVIVIVAQLLCVLPENRSTVIVNEALCVSQVCGLRWKVRCV